MTTLELGFTSNAISSYRRLSYTAWHALAEFVDNSTQSFFDNRDALGVAFSKKLGNDPGPLTVRIKYERAGGTLTIKDNAMGMDLQDLTRALQIAMPPPNPNGRSQYGLGLKTAACWFGDYWTLTTKKLGSDTEYTITVDVEQIRQGDLNLHLQTKKKDRNLHYTEIKIARLHRSLGGRTLGKIRRFLASMYRYDLRDKTLRLFWQNDELEHAGITQFLRDEQGNEYKQDFTFQIPSDDGKAKTVTGWFGILGGSDSGRSNAGFVIMRHRRALRAHPEEWRPELIFGDARNDLINQRITGEINMDEFEVSHTKDGIQWQGSDEDLIEEKLKDLLGPYLKRARETQVKRLVAITDREVSQSLAELEADLSPEHVDRALAMPVPEADVALLTQRSLIDGKREPRFVAQLPAGTVFVYVATDASSQDPYVAHDITAQDLRIYLNARHKQWLTLTPEGLTQFVRLCTLDALAEWRCLQEQVPATAPSLRSVKDFLLRSARWVDRD
jgi:hypothetical protein